jgi:hypothetical protein
VSELTDEHMRTTVHHACFDDGTVWSLPGDHPDGGLEWRLRYATPTTRTDALLAAGVVACYRELIRLPQRERNKRVKQLREAIGRCLNPEYCVQSSDGECYPCDHGKRDAGL